MISSPEMSVNTSIKFQRGFHFPKMFPKPSFKGAFGLSQHTVYLSLSHCRLEHI